MGTPVDRGTSEKVESFPYVPSGGGPPSCTTLDLPRLDAEGRSLIEKVEADPASEVWTDPKVDLRVADESRRSFAAGRERGIEEGRALERAAHLPVEQRRADELRRLGEDLAGERDRYLQAVEHEVVRLALAIAARILRREAQTDPLLLMGAVRAALGQLAGATEVRLHVPVADADLWEESIALLPNPPVRAVVIAEKDMRLGECRLEASLGEADLSLKAQLDEIERVLLAGGSSRALSAASMDAHP